MVVKVYLSCCGGEQVLKVVKEAISLSGTNATVETVTDFAEVAKAGIMSTPTIKIDNRVVASGRVPKAQDLAKLLTNVAATKES